MQPPHPTAAPEASKAQPLASGPTLGDPLPRELDLAGTNVVLTGGSSGLGLEATKMLCAKNAHVFVLGDNMERGRRALQEVQAAVPKARVDFFECDLASLASVRTAAAALKSLNVPLHVLALNAGTFLWPYRRTPEGFELTVATNYTAHFLLAHLLLPELTASTPSRIIWQGSALEQIGTVDWADLGGEWARDSDIWQYGRSKLYCLMAAREMAKRLKGTGVGVFAVEPGLVDTPLYDRQPSDKLSAWFFSVSARLAGQSPRRGACSLVYAAGAPELDGKPFAYFGPPYLGPLCPNVFNTARFAPLNPLAHSATDCRLLYEETARLLERKSGGQPLPHKLPAAYREHPWHERVAGSDCAHPVDATLEARPPPYRAHQAVARAQQAVRSALGGSAAEPAGVEA